MSIQRRLLAVLARALQPTTFVLVGLTIVAYGGGMVWAPLGVILFGMTIAITAGLAAWLNSRG